MPAPVLTRAAKFSQPFDAKHASNFRNPAIPPVRQAPMLRKILFPRVQRTSAPRQTPFNARIQSCPLRKPPPDDVAHIFCAPKGISPPENKPPYSAKSHTTSSDTPNRSAPIPSTSECNPLRAAKSRSETSFEFLSANQAGQLLNS